MTNPELLDATQLSQVLATTRRDFFRMETLPSYDVPINGNDRWPFHARPGPRTGACSATFSGRGGRVAYRCGFRAVVGSASATSSPSSSCGEPTEDGRFIRLTKPTRDELSATLQSLRIDADLSQVEAARRAGLSQATVSRFETGKQMPTEREIERLCDIYSAPARIRRGLVSIARTIRQETSKSRTVLQRHDAPRLQSRIALIERASARIRGLQTAIVWGLLQTHEYAEEIASRSFAGDEAEQFVARRMERRQVLDSDRKFTVVQTEGSLRWHVGSPAVMAAQMDQLVSDSRRPNMRLGVIPWTRPVRGAILHGFQIFDSRAVMVGTEAATALITDPNDVRHYEQRFAGYEALAVYRDKARAVFDRIACEYRGLT